jgi:hypothetical protein
MGHNPHTQREVRLFDSLPCHQCGEPAFFAHARPDEREPGAWVFLPICTNCEPVETMCLLPKVVSHDHQ